jgi:four helix bundle protein
VEELDVIYKSNAQGELQELSVQFARTARLFARVLWRTNSFERSSIDQLYRAAMSVGANVREAQFAESPKDFVHKLKIAEKELAEFYYWLGLLLFDLQTDTNVETELTSLSDLALRTKKLLATIITTLKRKHGL